MDGSIKGNGKTISSKVKDTRNSLIYQFIMAHIKKENRMDMENMNGRMVKIMKASGSMD